MLRIELLPVAFFYSLQIFMFLTKKILLSKKKKICTFSVELDQYVHCLKNQNILKYSVSKLGGFFNK